MFRKNLERRSFCASIATLSVTAGLGSVSGSKINPSVVERIEAVDQEALYNEFRDQFGPREAEKALKHWNRIAKKIITGKLSHSEGVRIFEKAMLRQTNNFASAIQKARGHGLSSTLSIQTDNNLNKTASDSEIDIYRFDSGEDGGPGINEYRAFDNGSDMLLARTYTAGYGNTACYAEHAGGYFNGGDTATHEVSVDLYRRGSTAGGNAEIKLFVEEVGGNRRTQTVASGSGRGDIEQTVEFTLSEETGYFVGVRVETSVSGIG